ncbi:hypothetical protein PAHAL_6G220500 [Panicum hallii]|uniref:Uncharacterized protein n=1 Tax=Panicum hallii TaxID=206008 RepID=A0A2T8IH89_9POAL|nr:hypothetical protein PAHAL_6G220500 [Panicum hallii]
MPSTCYMGCDLSMVDSPNHSIAETHAHTWMGSRCCNKATQPLGAVSLRIVFTQKDKLVMSGKREGTALSNDVEQKAREQSCMHMPFLDASSGSPAAIYLGDMLMQQCLKNLHSHYTVLTGQGISCATCACLTSHNLNKIQHCHESVSLNSLVIAVDENMQAAAGLL